MGKDKEHILYNDLGKKQQPEYVNNVNSLNAGYEHDIVSLKERNDSLILILKSYRDKISELETQRINNEMLIDGMKIEGKELLETLAQKDDMLQLAKSETMELTTLIASSLHDKSSLKESVSKKIEERNQYKNTLREVFKKMEKEEENTQQKINSIQQKLKQEQGEIKEMYEVRCNRLENTVQTQKQMIETYKNQINQVKDEKNELNNKFKT